MSNAIDIVSTTYVTMFNQSFPSPGSTVPVKSKISAKLVRWVQWQTVFSASQDSNDTLQPEDDQEREVKFQNTQDLNEASTYIGMILN